MRRVGSSLLGAAALAIVGCTNDALDLSGDGAAVPYTVDPLFPWNDLPTPIPTTTPVSEYGDGHDGPLTVSGTQVVNVCAAIDEISGGHVKTVPGAFAVGDRVLLWQAQDQFASSAGAAVVTTASMGLAGAWQLARVTALGGDYIDVDVTVFPYDTDTGISAQACRVPEYTSVDVPALQRIESAPWTAADGGGIVAFFVSGTLTLDGTVSASGGGFLGASAHQGLNSNEDVTLDETVATDGGRKGHGLDGRSAPLYGRRNWANGGGGGNSHSAGGGGGGNAGAGGLGGKQWKPAGNVAGTAGFAGGSVDATYPGRLVMGGGGGEGQCHHGGCGDAGDGGGVVLVFAGTLAGAGSVLANGDDAAPSNDDAGSGGGAGGMIVLRAGTSSFSGALRANGGNGADAVYDGGVGDDEISGPGGGGGGGRVQFLTAVGGAVVLEAAGGANGVNPLQGDDPWGATAGTDGVTAVSPE